MACVTDPFLFTQTQDRDTAASRVRAQLPAEGRNELLCTSAQGQPSRDAAERAAWSDWSGACVALRALFGEAFPATAAWQCAWACDELQRGKYAAANISVVGANLQAIGARFVNPTHRPGT